MLAGSREPVALAVERVSRRPAHGPANLYFSAKRTSAPAAAWINGTASHAVLDYDDVALKGCHPSAVLVPAILAEAQALNPWAAICSSPTPRAMKYGLT